MALVKSRLGRPCPLPLIIQALQGAPAQPPAQEKLPFTAEQQAWIQAAIAAALAPLQAEIDRLKTGEPR
ncbi:hypothetical protein [Gallaecimonas sp. GXIMD4217]|uniref:hypothetical protein n=1 Tax=Gallaecimonas sp. GXIMD4217 TaxID=3131927 RepID=UPI00311AC403